MRAKIRDKRIETFKKLFPDYKVTKKGNFMYEINRRKEERYIVNNGYNVTKGIFNKIGTTTLIEKFTSDTVFLITTTGKLLLKDRIRGRISNNFKAVTIKDLIHRGHSTIKDVFFIGRKFEYMATYKGLWGYRIFQNFNSLKEAKLFLGFNFISDSGFYEMFKHIHKYNKMGLGRICDIIFYISLCKTKENKVDIHNLILSLNKESLGYLKDYIDLSIERGTEVQIPRGINKLKELHDTQVKEANKENADCYSKEKKYYIENESFTSIWEEHLKFKKLNTPYEMFLQGCIQHHCIGTNYYRNLHSHSFYTILWEGKEYDLQINPKGYIGQFLGKYNSQPPKKLTNIINNDNIDYKHSIRQVPGTDLTKYPLVKELSGDNIPF